MSLPSEYRVLTSAASPTEADDVDQRQAGLQGLDWDRLERLAGRHRLGPLLWRWVSGCPAVVPALAERLEQGYLENAARNLYVQAELTRVLGALDEAGVAAMPLKGAALIESVYPDAALRVMRDLDILVRAGDAERAQAAVVDLGYRSGANLRGEEGSSEWMDEHHYHLPPLIGPERLLAVELHRHLVPPGDPARFDIAGFWDRARPAATGTPHLVAAPEDLLTHVALHFSRNRLWRSEGALAQVTDVAWVLDRLPLDWDALVGRARDDGSAPSLFLGLYAARELLGSEVPRSAMAGLRPASFRDVDGRRFLERRVLREREWLSLEVFTSKRPPLMRIRADGDWLRERYGAGQGAGVSRLYVRRAVQAGRRFGPSLARPWELGADLVLNRWMRSLERR